MRGYHTNAGRYNVDIKTWAMSNIDWEGDREANARRLAERFLYELRNDCVEPDTIQCLFDNISEDAHSPLTPYETLLFKHCPEYDFLPITDRDAMIAATVAYLAS